ncbi:hypothetical protein FA15DRAFT_760030 [Coprinopsis marcescibilis]|uniref:F-box domain-containing protein n=1 Tax=Coprinopsis marcescibilis TaxID=230819 RepID=A0A5C3KH97_COPMA|nr:hypothetical protein FA15DRAFT_760030 [Coprinopsis marcescibilis]
MFASTRIHRPTIPSELIQHTVSYLTTEDGQPDETLLHNTSLVSPTFRRHSQELLFSRVELVYPAQLGKQTAAAKLLSVINDSPRLFAYITTVVLASWETMSCAPLALKEQDLQGDKALVDVLNKLATLGRVKAFTLWEKYFRIWDFVPAAAMDALAAICGSAALRTLKIDGGPMSLLTCCSPSIKTLILESLHEYSFIGTTDRERLLLSSRMILHEPPARKSTITTRVESLKIHDYHYHEEVPHPKIHNSPGIDLGALKSIELTSTQRSTYSQTNNLLQHCPPSLEEVILELYEPYHRNAGDFPELSRFVGLTKATFFIRSAKPPRNSSEGDWGLFLMSQVIDSIPASSPLKSVDICVMHLRRPFDEPRRLSAFYRDNYQEWDKIFDSLFQTSKFPDLQSLTLTIYRPKCVSATPEVIVRVLPRPPENVRFDLRILPIDQSPIPNRDSRAES